MTTSTVLKSVSPAKSGGAKIFLVKPAPCSGQKLHCVENARLATATRCQHQISGGRIMFKKNVIFYCLINCHLCSGQLVAVKGTVVRVSNIQPFCTQMAFECQGCRNVQVREYPKFKPRFGLLECTSQRIVGCFQQFVTVVSLFRPFCFRRGDLLRRSLVPLLRAEVEPSCLSGATH